MGSLIAFESGSKPPKPTIWLPLTPFCAHRGLLPYKMRRWIGVFRIWIDLELFLENLIKFVEVFNKIAINRLLALAVILAIIALLIAIVKQKLSSH
jgi:hypothetical protein